MALFPSVIASLTNPQTTDKLNSPSHAGIETAQNNELVQIENIIGLTGNSSVLGTIIGDLRSPGSGGGGHVQTAVLGGTGQTAFTKGDLLIAQSSSVVSKLGVGSDGQVLTADSTQTQGIKWGATATAANIQNQAFTYIRGSVMSASVYGITPSPVVSMLIDGQSFDVKWPSTNTTSVLAVTVGATGPSSVTALLKNTDGTNPIIGAIQASMVSRITFESVSSVFQLHQTYLPTYGASVTTFLRNDGLWGAPTLVPSWVDRGSIVVTNTGSPQSFSPPTGQNLLMLKVIQPIGNGLINLTFNNDTGANYTRQIMSTSSILATASLVNINIMGDINTPIINPTTLTFPGSIAAGFLPIYVEQGPSFALGNRVVSAGWISSVVTSMITLTTTQTGQSVIGHLYSLNL